jgi:beta-lactam-binding protein with PASTA domain
MPSVVGETLSAAQKLLTDLGLKVIVNTDQIKANWGVAKVRTASAAANTKLKAGDTVTISNLR